MNGELAPLVGHELLNAVRDAIRRYCILPGPHELVAVTLWVVLTHLLTQFDYAPRLVARSAEKRSGKSRLLEVVDALVYSPLRAVNCTVSYVFRSLSDDPPPTLLLDECDTIFGSKKVAENNEELRGLLNAGFQRGLTFGRTVGPTHVPTEFSTFSMAALAGIGRMPETIEDRAVVVVMKRRMPGEMVQPYRVSRDQPALHRLRAEIAEWAADVSDQVKDADPDLPVEDRAADLWAPMVRVADLAGGPWPALARAAATAMVDSAADEDTARSTNMQLLADARDVFIGKFMKSADLCQQLRQISESPWDQYDLNPSKLGRRLREYEIKTRHSDDKSERGYHLSDFSDAFTRYLTPLTKMSEGVQGVPQIPDQHAKRDTLTEHKVSEHNPQGVPDTADVAKASQSIPSSNDVPDTLDTMGHLPGGTDTPTPAVMPSRAAGFERAPRERRRTIRGKPFHAEPACLVCNKPVVGGQGDTHFSCSKDRTQATA